STLSPHKPPPPTSRTSHHRQPLAQATITNRDKSQCSNPKLRSREETHPHKSQHHCKLCLHRNSSHTMTSSPLRNHHEAFVHPQFSNPNSRGTISKSLLIATCKQSKPRNSNSIIAIMQPRLSAMYQAYSSSSREVSNQIRSSSFISLQTCRGKRKEILEKNEENKGWLLRD
ncbi:hypothetical protein V8G54_011291, partial [Vigna mungo]